MIGLALVANAIAGLPLPDATTPDTVARDWKWTTDHVLGVLRAAGSKVERSTVERRVAETATAAAGLHAQAKRPFSPFFALTQSTQAWDLFSSAPLRPERLVVSIQRAGDPSWEVVERRLDPCCTWRDAQVRYRRVRGLWDQQPSQAKPEYDALARWLAGEGFADFPDATRVRVLLSRHETNLPWEPVRARETTRLQREFARDELGR